MTIAAVALATGAGCGDEPVRAWGEVAEGMTCGLLRAPGTRTATCAADARLDLSELGSAYTIDVAVALDRLPAEDLSLTRGAVALAVDRAGSVRCDAGGRRAVSAPFSVATGEPVVLGCQRSAGGVRVLAGDRDVTIATVAAPLGVPARGGDGSDVVLTGDARIRGGAVHALDPQGAFTLAVLPDTQYYTSRAFGASAGALLAQTQWIAANRDRFNIRFALHEGDCVEHDHPQEWTRFADAMRVLDRAGVGYAITTGNHDLVGNAETRATHMSRAFPPDDALARGLGGTWRPGEIENAWYAFRAGGDDWLVLALEFGPREGVLVWADAVVRAHPRHRVIVLTHAYVHSDDTLQGPGDPWSPHDYTLEYFAGEVNDGEEMWDKLVRRHAGMALVFSGHVLDDGTGLVIGTGDHGNRVVQMLANYQMRGAGGDGFMRIATIDPARGRLAVRSFSPWLREWLDGDDHAFDIGLDGN